MACKLQQVVLPGSGCYQFFGWCAEGSRTNWVEVASIFIHVVAVIAGFGFVDVSVQEEAESGNGKAIEECGVCDAVFACTMDRMMPYGDF